MQLRRNKKKSIDARPSIHRSFTWWKKHEFCGKFTFNFVVLFYRKIIGWNFRTLFEFHWKCMNQVETWIFNSVKREKNTHFEFTVKGTFFIKSRWKKLSAFTLWTIYLILGIENFVFVWYYCFEFEQKKKKFGALKIFNLHTKSLTILRECTIKDERLLSDAYSDAKNDYSSIHHKDSFFFTQYVKYLSRWTCVVIVYT